MLNAYAPPFKVVGAYFIVACIGFCACLLVGVYGGSEKAFLHCFFIGFLLNALFGSLYQLSSVVYEKAFISTRGAILFCFLSNLSLILLVFGFYDKNYTLVLYAGVIVFLHIYYFIMLFLWSFFGFKNFSQMCLFFGVLFLGVGVLCALLLLGMHLGFVHIEYGILLYYHIYFMLGFVLFVSMGAGSLLLPMFSLNHQQSLILLKIGFTSYLLGISQIKYFAFFAVLCFVLWGLLMIKNRVRKALDYWNLNIVFAMFGLLIGLFYAFFENYKFALMFLVLGGILPFVVGHLYKILPFLIWYHYIAPFAGKIKVPLLNDMVNAKIAYIALICNLFLVFSILIQGNIIWILFGIYLTFLSINVIYIFSFTFFKGEKHGK